MANRMHGIKFQIFPDFDTHFSKPTGATPLALMQAELVLPEQFYFMTTEALAQLLNRGRYGLEKAQKLKQSAHTTFATEYADAAHSYLTCAPAESQVRRHVLRV